MPKDDIPQEVSIERWRNAALAREVFTEQMAEPLTKWVLVTAEYAYDEGFETYSFVGDGEQHFSPDGWFIVPRALAMAYQNARETVRYLEAHLEAHRQKSGHTKRINGRRVSLW